MRIKRAVLATGVSRMTLYRWRYRKYRPLTTYPGGRVDRFEILRLKHKRGLGRPYGDPKSRVAMPPDRPRKKLGGKPSRRHQRKDYGLAHFEGFSQQWKILRRQIGEGWLEWSGEDAEEARYILRPMKEFYDELGEAFALSEDSTAAD